MKTPPNSEDELEEEDESNEVFSVFREVLGLKKRAADAAKAVVVAAKVAEAVVKDPKNAAQNGIATTFANATTTSTIVTATAAADPTFLMEVDVQQAEIDLSQPSYFEAEDSQKNHPLKKKTPTRPAKLLHKRRSPLLTGFTILNLMQGASEATAAQLCDRSPKQPPFSSTNMDHSSPQRSSPYSSSDCNSVLPCFEPVSKGTELEHLKERVVEGEEKNVLVLKALESLSSIKDCLSRVAEGLEGEEDVTYVKELSEEPESESESNELMEVLKVVSRYAREVETRIEKHTELRKKEKRELESSLISLTEENRDVSNLLRIALLEKEALEKRVKGNEHNKRMPLLQFAEFGLHKVGFGFMMGTGTVDQPIETKSDSSESEHVASTVERIMKNLRLEITHLRRSLEEARSDTERLQCLTEKQGKEIAENKEYIKDLEDRERVLAHNVEEFMMEIREAEEEVARWKEACELEVVAGKNEIQERDKLVDALKLELQKTKGALEISRGKLRLKEEVAATAIAAQEAAERSLKLADTRAVELRERMEELTKQLEEADKRERTTHKRRRRRRRLCWPWQLFNLASPPEMNALLY
ncbi:uncharacterized protein At3g49055 [Arachis stenosperma]|uniref:uncharacterized protein At3g49055 n=1 Tax=Arachis stenosperma TaxID=217475 RepID=UPI0025AC426B|nr:uncharacterized protein At3g49055 [Arachis stenosperma]